MKKFLIVLMFFSYRGFAQDFNYSESGDTLFIKQHTIIPGDTIHLGIGSSPVKNFLFVWEVPTKKNISIKAGTYQPKYLSKMFSNGFLIYAGKMDEGNKKLPLPTPVFFLSGNKDFKYNIDLLSAVKTNEVIL